MTRATGAMGGGTAGAEPQGSSGSASAEEGERSADRPSQPVPSGRNVRALAAGLRIDRTIALVGMMGAGKSTIGRRLAAALNVAFRDADEEIERAAGLSIQEIFDQHGESEFRRGERRVIARLLEGSPHVLATGGGAFIQPETRALMQAHAVTVWLRADIDTLMRRVERRDHRPLLKEDDPRAVMQRLIDARYPIYAEAELVVESIDSPHAAAVEAVLKALRARQDQGAAHS